MEITLMPTEIEWINKLWYSCKVKYTTMKKNKSSIHFTIWMYFTDIILGEGSQTLCTEYVLYISMYIQFRNKQNKPMALTSGWSLIFGGQRAERGPHSGCWLHSVLCLENSLKCTLLICTLFSTYVFMKVTQKEINRKAIDRSKYHQ